MAYGENHYVHEYKGRRFLILHMSDGWHWLEDGPGNERSGPYERKRDAMSQASNKVDLDAAKLEAARSRTRPKRSLLEIRLAREEAARTRTRAGR